MLLLLTSSAVARPAGFSGEGALTVARAASLSKSVALSASAALTGAPMLAAAGSPTLAGVGALTAVGVPRPGAAPILASDTWDQPDGSAWGPQWSRIGGWDGQTAPIAPTIVNGRGRLSSGTGSDFAYSIGTAELNQPFADFDLRVDFCFPDNGSIEEYFEIDVAIDKSVDYPDDTWAVRMVHLETGLFEGTWTSAIVTREGGTDSYPITVNIDYQVGETWTVRFQRIGGHFAAKLWLTGTAEPIPWVMEIDYANLTAGPIKLGVMAGADDLPTSVDVDNLLITGVSAAATTFSGTGDLASSALSAGGDVPTFTGSGTLEADGQAVVLPYTETFTGADGSAWPVRWAQFGGGSATIQGNAGRIVAAAGSYGTTFESLNVGTALGDIEVTGTVVGAVTGVEQYAYVAINSDGTFGQYSTNNGYTFMLWCIDNTTAKAGLYEESGGVETQLGPLGPQRFNTPATTRKSFRVQRIGQVFRGKFWNTGDIEPTDWDVSYTLPGTPKVGNSVALSTQRGDAGTGGTFTFDDVVVAVPPPSWTAGAVFSVEGGLAASSVPGALASGVLGGSGSLGAVQSTAISVFPAFSGLGGLTASPVLGSVAVAGFAGSGRLTAGSGSAGVPGVAVAAALTAAGGLLATPSVSVARTAALSAAGGLLATPMVAGAATALFAAAGALHSSTVTDRTDGVALSGIGLLAGAAAAASAGQAVLAAAGVLSATARVAQVGAATFTSIGVLAASVNAQVSVVVALSTAGSLTGSTLASRADSPILSSSAALSANGLSRPVVSASFTGSVLLTAAAEYGVVSAVSLGGAGVLDAGGAAASVQTPGFAGVGVLSAAAIRTTSDYIQFSGSSVLAAGGAAQVYRNAHFGILEVHKSSLNVAVAGRGRAPVGHGSPFTATGHGRNLSATSRGNPSPIRIG